MNEIELIDKWAAKLEAALVQFGDKGADIALTLGWVGSFEKVGVGLIFLITAIVLLMFAFKNLMRFEANKLIIKQVDGAETYEERRAKRALRDEADASIDRLAILVMAQTVLSCIFFVTAILRLIDIYAWIGLYRPEVFLAARALGW